MADGHDMKITRIRRREGTDDEGRHIYMYFHRGILSLRRAPRGGDTVSALEGEEIFSKEIAYGYDVTYQDLRRLVEDKVDLPDHDRFSPTSLVLHDQLEGSDPYQMCYFETSETDERTACQRIAQ